MAQPLAVEGDAASAGQARAVTVRMRWRELPIDSILVDRDGARWLVTQTQEIGRRRWLDVNLSTYRQPARETVEQRADFIPPVGWGFTVDGLPWSRIEIATCTPHNAQDRGGTFVVPAGLSGAVADAQRVTSWWFRLGSTGELGVFELVESDNIRAGYLRLRFVDAAGLPVTAIADVPSSPFWLFNSSVPVGAGDVLELLSRAEVDMIHA